MTHFHLYRHYDAKGNLLYVGQSNNAFKRYEGHQSTSKWAVASVMMRVEHFASREAAMAAEQTAILTENPQFNRCTIARPDLNRRRGREVTDPRCFQMRATPAFMKAVEDWRAAQRPIPSLTEAICRLVELGLSSKGGKK